VSDNPMLVCTNWCIRCWPKKEYAQMIYSGQSLCPGCYEYLTGRGLKFVPDAEIKARRANIEK
jgi:hypothetical protein